MAEKPLVHRLADVLYDTYIRDDDWKASRPHDKPYEIDDIGDDEPGERDRWLRVARDCLRQMEWARRVSMDDDVTRPWTDEDAREWASKVPMTIAPDSWKP